MARNKYQQLNTKNGFGKVTVVAASIGLVVALFLLAVFLYANVLNKKSREVVEAKEFSDGQMVNDRCGRGR